MVALASLSKKYSIRLFDASPHWFAFTKLSRRFKNFDVLIDQTTTNINYVIVDPKKYRTTDSLEHEISGINHNIPANAIVGGIELYRTKAPNPIKAAYQISYMAFAPNYQGKGLPFAFYLWMLKNADLTGIGVLQAGDSQTPGSIKLWKALAKKLAVFAYHPKRRRFSTVDVTSDDTLESDFQIYPEINVESLKTEKEKELTKLEKQLKKEKSSKTHRVKELKKLRTEYDREIKENEDADVVRLYATLKR